MIEQSKLIMQQHQESSTKSDIRFDLLSSNVSKVLFDASENIKKLYFNYVGNIEKESLNLSVINITDKLREESLNHKKSSDIGARKILYTVGHTF